MKNNSKFSRRSLFILLIFSIPFSSCLASCSLNDEPAANKASNNPPAYKNKSKMKLTVGDKIFKVTLLDNPSVNAFKALLPMTITMNELNNNEKVHYLNTALPTNSRSVGKIHVGDFLLYGNNAVVLFYESFNTIYNYTRLGKVDDVTGLKEALGSGNVTVKFELQ
ncbi:cyclophilin-like fold protein [Pedobacter sp.]|uniref:cyclophilin-like fold protein n=1 Tax=Pedobacter sp. TaxID=1411316 RepID=UPI003D7F919C